MDKPLAKGQKPLRAALTLVIVALIVGLALWFNRPSTKVVKFDIFAERFILPTDVTFDLNGVTQMKSVDLVSYSGSVSNVTKLSLSTENAKPKIIDISKVGDLTFARGADNPPPFLSLTPQGALSEVSLKLDRGVGLGSIGTGDNLPKL